MKSSTQLLVALCSTLASVPVNAQPVDNNPNTPTISAISAIPAGQEKPQLQVPESKPLVPGTFWEWDTSSVQNIVPVPANKIAKLYYGVPKKNVEGNFAFMNLQLKMPSVNLDHSNLIKEEVVNDQTFKMTFSNDEGFKIAVATWKVDNGFVLITNSQGCTAKIDKDHCFFKASKLDIQKNQRVIVATGEPVHPGDITQIGLSQWGWHKANSTEASQVNAILVAERTAATPPSPQGRRDSNEKRDFLGIGSFFKDTGNAIKNKGEEIGKDIVDGGKAFGEAAKISAEFILNSAFNHNLEFDLPEAKDEVRTGPSPFGNKAKKIASIQGSKPAGKTELSGNVDVYCVDCHTKVNMKIAGTAAWDKGIGKITQGKLDIASDMTIFLQAGFDAQGTVRKDVNTDIFTFNLTPVTFGVVSIGPFLTIGSHLGLETTADGTLLIGTEIDLKGGLATLNFADPAASSVKAWSPTAKQPTIKAEGSVQLSAQLGLPVALEFGIKIGPFKQSIAIVDEPSIKAVAKVSGTVGVDKGKVSGGITETNGCAGVDTEISFKNEVFVTALNAFRKTLFDTGDKKISGACIKVPTKALAAGSPSKESLVPGSPVPVPGSPAPPGGAAAPGTTDRGSPGKAKTSKKNAKKATKKTAKKTAKKPAKSPTTKTQPNNPPNVKTVKKNVPKPNGKNRLTAPKPIPKVAPPKRKRQVDVTY